MKDIDEMSLQELYEEKEKIMKTLFLVGAAYKMERVLKINERKKIIWVVSEVAKRGRL